MKTVGAFEAKTQLARLLGEIARGGVVTITKQGRPVAKLVPPDPLRPRAETIIRELRASRRGVEVGLLSLRELIEEGRS